MDSGTSSYFNYNRNGKPPKTALQEWCVKSGYVHPVYQTTQTGPSHIPTFTSTVTINGLEFQGNGKSRVEAESNAALKAFSLLNGDASLSAHNNPQKGTFGGDATDISKISTDMFTDVKSGIASVSNAVQDGVKKVINNISNNLSSVESSRRPNYPHRDPDYSRPDANHSHSTTKTTVTQDKNQGKDQSKDQKHPIANTPQKKYKKYLYIDGLTSSVTISDVIKNKDVMFYIYYPKNAVIPSDVPTEDDLDNVDLYMTGGNHIHCLTNMILTLAVITTTQNNDCIIVGKSDQCHYASQFLTLKCCGEIATAILNKDK